MIYVDTSVGLAQILAEDRVPSEELWDEALVTSRLFEYEVWNAIHRRKLGRSHGDIARRLIESLAMVELSRDVLQRATERFPLPVRTPDALHLASMLFLIERGVDLRLASYDRRLQDAAAAMKIKPADL